MTECIQEIANGDHHYDCGCIKCWPESQTEQHEMTRGEQRAAFKMLMMLQDGDVHVGGFDDIAIRYQNYRKIPPHTVMDKQLLEAVVGDFLDNCNWLEESRTYAATFGNAKTRMKWFFLDALAEKMESSLGDCEVGDMEWFEEVGWEEYTNNHLRIIKFVKPDGLNRAHDFWFATNEDYAHQYSMDNYPEYAHKWMMENDAGYKAAYEAEQARLAKEAEENDS